MEDNLSHQDDKELIKKLLMEIAGLKEKVQTFEENKQSLAKNANFQDVCQTDNQPQRESNSFKNEESSKIVFQTYKKRSGTNDAGKEFEYMMCALYALKLCNNKDIIDFKITTNNEEYGDFDDISLEINTENGTKTFLLQLKHKENEKQYLTNQKLISPKSEFTLTKYLESFEKLDVGDATCLVYTNSSAKLENGSSFDILYRTQKNSDEQSEERKINVTVRKPQELEFFHLLQNKWKSDTHLHLLQNEKYNEVDDIFQFDITQEEIRSSVLESFCESFFLLTGQDNVKTVKETVRNLLTSLLKVDIYDSFIFFMKEWWSGTFVLTKRDVISKLVELAMSPWIQTMTSTKVDSKPKLLSTGIMSFDMTIVKNTNNDVINDIWDDPTEEPELGRVTHKYYIHENQNQRSKILWFLDKVPLIVKVEPQNKEQVEHSIKLLECLSEKKKLILVGDVGRGGFPKWKVLENLKDLCSSKDIYDEVVRHFKISLQGRKSISLEELIRYSKDFVDAIEMDDLLKMAQQECLAVGNIENSLPEFYIPRKVSAVYVNTTYLLDQLKHLKKTVLIINCSADFKNALSARHVSVMELDDFLRQKNLDTIENLILLSIGEPCTYSKFESVHKNLDNFQVYLFQTVDEDCCIYLMNVGHKQLRHCKNMYIEETKTFSYFKNELNVLFAPPGMGKSTFFNVLSKNCPLDLWVVYVKLIDHNSFLAKQPHEQQLLRHFLQVVEGTRSLDTKISNIYLKNKKILILLDGVDELHSQNVNFLLNRAKCLSSQGFHVWLSSRENWQQIISQNLKFFTTVDIVELAENEQKLYIEKRLEEKYCSYDIKKIVDATFDSIEIAKSRQLLGTPLLLYIITENFLTNKNLFLTLKEENIFVLTTMYRFFFEGKKKFHFKKIDMEESEEQLGLSFKRHLKQYELPALRICLDNRAFEKVNLNEYDCQDFLEEIGTKGDKFGIIRYLTPDNRAVFFHQTYAEYFACVWLTQNLGKVKLLREEWFLEKYRNLRLMFDIMLSEESLVHLTVIYNNIEQFDKNIDNRHEDKAGRNALYLACCYGKKYSLSRKLNYTTRRESQIVRSLLERCQNIFEEDTLFGINYIDYALNSRCLYVIEVCLELKLLSFKKIDKLLQKYYRFDMLAFQASQMDYIHLLKNVLERVGHKIIFHDFESCRRKLSLLSVAIIGTRNQLTIEPRKENVASVKEILKCRDERIFSIHTKWNLQSIDIYLRKKDLIGKQLENGELLSLCCEYGYCKIMKILLHYQSTYKGDNILHMTVKYGTLNDEVLELSKTIGLDVDQKNKYLETPLCLAFKADKEQFVKKLLDFGAEVNVPNMYGRYPLFYACERGSIKYVKLFLQNGAKINASVLHYAADTVFSEEMGLLNLFIENNADVNLQNSKGQTPLHIAVQRGRWRMIGSLSFDSFAVPLEWLKRQNEGELLRKQWNKVETLLDSGADINVRDDEGMTVLHYVASYPENVENITSLMTSGYIFDLLINGQKVLVVGDTKEWYFVKRLYDSGADVNVFVSEKITVMSSDEFTVENVKRLLDNGVSLVVARGEFEYLFLAAMKHGRQDTLNRLFDCVKDIDMDNQKMAVHHFDASVCEDVENIRLLVDNGVNLNAQNKKGKTALHLAVENRNYNKLKALVKFGADVNVVDDNKENVLHYAMRHFPISKEAEYVSKVSINNHVDINAQNVHGESPLHLACQYHDLSVVEVLLENGADENLITLERKNMLHYAAESWCQDNITELLEKGFDKDAQDINGTTILHCACRSGRLKNIQILISSGANIHAIDNKQHTILHYAAMSPHPEEDVMKYLVETGVDIYAKDSKGRNALDVAFEHKCFKALQLLIETEKFFDPTQVPWSTQLYYSAFGGCCHGINYLIENCKYISALDLHADVSLSFLKSRGKFRKKLLLKMTNNVYFLIEILRNYPSIVYEPPIFIKYCKLGLKLFVDRRIDECIFKYPKFYMFHINTAK